MAFQQLGLFPWMTSRQTWPWDCARGATGPTPSHRRRFLDPVGLAEFKDAYPNQLSGGMAQRVGIARALALRPRLLLLDEPFAAVDAFTRLKLQQDLKGLFRRYRPTVMFVTHDVPEAIALGDVIVVMSQRPARWCASFRSPPTNATARAFGTRTARRDALLPRRGRRRGARLMQHVASTSARKHQGGADGRARPARRAGVDGLPGRLAASAVGRAVAAGVDAGGREMHPRRRRWPRRRRPHGEGAVRSARCMAVRAFRWTLPARRWHPA